MFHWSWADKQNPDTGFVVHAQQSEAQQPRVELIQLTSNFCVGNNLFSDLKDSRVVIREYFILKELLFW